MGAFITTENVFVDQHAQSREEVLRAVADAAFAAGKVSDADTVYQAFLAREEMGETGMTEGFAVPHAKSDAITEAAVYVYKNDHALEWPSFDEQPVDIAIALLVPDSEAGSTHIKLLSKTAVLLMDANFKKTVRETTDPQVIVDAILAGLDAE